MTANYCLLIAIRYLKKDGKVTIRTHTIGLKTKLFTVTHLSHLSIPIVSPKFWSKLIYQYYIIMLMF